VPRVLTSRGGRRRVRRRRLDRAAALLTTGAFLAAGLTVSGRGLDADEIPSAPGPVRAPSWQLVDAGGGYGGESGSAIWAEAWWQGSPTGPGPYTGSPSGGAGLCIWHDLGPSVADLDDGLSEASLPESFWHQPESGGHPGIWGVDEWAHTAAASGSAGDHFDLVACPSPSQVPAGGPDIETSLPRARPPGSRPLYVWVFWDTVPFPPPGGLPPLVQQAFDETGLPSPEIGTSPASVGGTPDATVVNFPTWLWIDPSVWHEYLATAEAGGYVATVWAWPSAVDWSARWDFADAGADPEGGVSDQPEVLDQSCPGPGATYDLARPAAGQATDCSFVFTESTFGTAQTLSASVVWDVHWAYSSAAGVVGGEGSFAPVETTGTRPIRVLQIESIITRG